jgi:two-component system LytT family response regulator
MAKAPLFTKWSWKWSHSHNNTTYFLVTDEKNKSCHSRRFSFGCNELKELIKNHPEIEIIGEAENVDLGFELINNTQPDLLFLWHQHAWKDGFACLKCSIMYLLRFYNCLWWVCHQVIWIQCLDYLLKPINPKRFAVEKSKYKLDRKSRKKWEETSFRQSDFIRDGEMLVG